MENAARKNDNTPEVRQIFNTIEDAFEQLASHGFKCYAVLSDNVGLKSYKIERETNATGNGLILKVFDASEQMAANAASEKAPEYLSSVYGEGAASIEDAAENIRASVSAIRALVRNEKELATHDIATLAKIAEAEAEGIVHVIKSVDANF